MGDEEGNNNYITIPKATYKLFCNQDDCQVLDVSAFAVYKFPITEDDIVSCNCVSSYQKVNNSKKSHKKAVSGSELLGVAIKYIDWKNTVDSSFQYRLPNRDEMLVMAFGSPPVIDTYSEEVISKLSAEQGNIMIITDTRPVTDRIKNNFGIVGLLDANKELIKEDAQDKYYLFSPIIDGSYRIYTAPSSTSIINATNFRLIREPKEEAK